MMDEKNTNEMTGTLAFDEERNCLLLDGHELSSGENIEIYVFGSWIPGHVAIDAAGWYLVTLDQVGIRLHAGLLARSCDFRFSPQIVAQAVSQQQQQAPTILIVDDDPALLHALPRTISLRLPHVEVSTAQSAPMALQLLKEKRYDAIVSDIKMPEMDGLTLLSKIRESQPDTPTILITGHGEHNLAIQALRGGAYDYIQKPIERDNFVAALLRAIQTCQLRRQVQEQQQALELYTRSLERLVQQRTEELAEAHTTKDKVLSLVSQELKEPITRLKSLTQLLRQKLEGSELSEIVTRSFSTIEESIERTEALVHELLNTSSIDTQRFILRRQRCDLARLCHSILQEETSDTDMQLEHQGLAGPLEVEVDEKQIRQVLSTLIDSTQSSIRQQYPTTITLQQVGKEAILTLRDQGAHSLGAGFYIARKIVERHNGHMEIQNFPDDRRALFMKLPLSEDNYAQRQDLTSSIPQTHAIWTISYGDSGALA
ncbi:response regulator [Dictyobacter aurantiacus]|uniref:histidine kinase n=1 Tax=Dictyobacter aurantiacus TaxID=1936993 RepID=A0A401ZAH5_9CHLR|nr:response regulator [Dictyobacter aurantiacus]GCE03832.1 hybrid sensor histidine kinase/response regulator [Dictyobacter aurantiacus]